MEGRPYHPPIMSRNITIQANATGLRLGIAVSRYHGWATDRMLSGAIDRWARLGGGDDDVTVVAAPGTWELTPIAAALARSSEIDVVVALGVVLRGETDHFDYICDGVTQGLTQAMHETGKVVGFGVLTCDTREQVEARVGGEVGNKGAEAVSAAVEATQAIRMIANANDTD